MKGYSLWLVWESTCWKCGEKLMLAEDTIGWSYNPFLPTRASGMWSKEKDEGIESELAKKGVKREMRYSQTIEDSYMANVCPHCGALQGDWFVQEEGIDVVYSLGQRLDAHLVLFRDGKKVQDFPTLRSFESWVEAHQREWKKDEAIGMTKS